MTIDDSIHRLLAGMVLAGASAFEIHADGAVLLEAPTGERYFREAPESGIDQEHLDQIVHRLKRMAGILSPSPWFSQRGKFQVSGLNIGGVRETLTVNLYNVPAQPQTPTSFETHEVIRVEMEIEPWLSALFLFGWLLSIPVSLGLGIYYNVGGVISVVLCTLGSIGIHLSHPRAYADRKAYRWQESTMLAAIPLALFGVGSMGAFVWDVFTEAPHDPLWAYLLALLVNIGVHHWMRRSNGRSMESPLQEDEDDDRDPQAGP